eukprot:8222383-Lingulodinium_polyedra.AAC.1
MENKGQTPPRMIKKRGRLKVHSGSWRTRATHVRANACTHERVYARTRAPMHARAQARAAATQTHATDA